MSGIEAAQPSQPVVLVKGRAATFDNDYKGLGTIRLGERFCTMDINRNQFFMLGVLVLLLGIQFRVVDRYVLNDKATRVLANRMAGEDSAQAAALRAADATNSPIPRHVVEPPDWSGWCMMSIGSVLILHSLALRKPD